MMNLDGFFNELLNAVANDLADMSANEQVRRNAEFIVSRILGVDVSSPFIKPYFDRLYDGGMAYAKEMVAAASTDPDGSAEFISEQAREAAGRFAEALKKRNQAKKQD